MTLFKKIFGAGDESEYECPDCEVKMIWAEYSEDYYGNTSLGLQCEVKECNFDAVEPDQMEDFINNED